MVERKVEAVLPRAVKQHIQAATPTSRDGAVVQGKERWFLRKVERVAVLLIAAMGALGIGVLLGAVIAYYTFG